MTKGLEACVMHDPLVVAFEVRRPWPRRGLAGRRYWPPIITVWHREPGGHDSGEVCRQHLRWQDEAGDWQIKALHGWKLHIRHWKIQIHPAQMLRRRLLTRCAWCGGRSRKGDQVNCSHSWDGPSGRWWRGEPGLYHGDCSSVATVYRMCFCADPLLNHSGYGQCAVCGKFRSYGKEPDDADRLLASLPKGSRITPELRPQIE